MSNQLQHLVAPRSHVSQEMRELHQKHRGMAFWLTGLSGSGKSTLAHAAEKILFLKGYNNIVVLDGDAIRLGLCKDLGFSSEDRKENNRRVAELAKVLIRNGAICLCAFISPSADARQAAKEIIGADFFREIFISCSAEECELRDVKGFYAKARKGEIKNYTGVSALYEPPTCPDLLIPTGCSDIEACTIKMVDFILTQSKH